MSADGAGGKLFFRIGEVAQILGVDTHVVRYWESEFEIEPHRSNSGQRLYRKEDLASYLRIKHLLHGEGYTIAGARKVLAGEGGVELTVDVERIREVIGRLDNLRDRLHRTADELGG